MLQTSSGSRPGALPKGRPRIAITHGDPNGIGPEVALKALTDRRLLQFFEPILVGSAHVFRRYAHQYNLGALRLRIAREVSTTVPEGSTKIIDTLPGRKARIAVGQTTPEAGRLALEAVGTATELAIAGEVDGIVTAPISKHAIALADYDFAGHTEFLARQTGAKNPMMMMVAASLRVGLVTIHMPIKRVAGAVRRSVIKQRIKSLCQSLVQDFGIARPKVAVLGLNPHAGEGGVLGSEETEEILPAIQESCRNSLLAFGPFPADGFFGTSAYRQYDAVLAMYHDQGLVPFKALAFEEGVNFTAGLPIVRTSPDHGTAFGIAGQGIASPLSLRKAILLAIDIVRQRQKSELWAESAL